MQTFTGVGVSPGRIIGAIRQMPKPISEPPAGERLPEGVPAEEATAALKSAAKAVHDGLKARSETVSGDGKAVLEATALMATDTMLLKAAAKLIGRGTSSERAIWEAGASVAEMLHNLGGYMAERAADVLDVRSRIVAELRGVPAPGIPASTTPFILVAEDLAPADTATLDPETILALVTAGGGPQSHTAIIARSLGLPAVVAATGVELGDRFPGTPVGVIGQQGLSGPDDLAIIIGYTPSDLANVPNTIRVTAIHTAPRALGNVSIYNFGFVLGAIALLLPMLILIGNATRLAAARREERYAAMRLVGATPRQVSVIASVDAVVGALLGSMLGVGVFAAIQPLAARVSITGSPFFPDYITPAAAGYAAVLIGVPVAAAAASVLSLRRVGISPLGVSRRATPPPPRAWRVVPLFVGLLVFILPLTLGNSANPNVLLAALGLALIMIGLMVGGTWLTMQAARLLGRFSRGASSLLAARRMADNPKVAFRSVSGLVLAVFVGTLLAGAVPAALAAQQTPTDTGLNNVLRVRLGDGPHGLGSQTAATITNQLKAFGGVDVLTLYTPPPDGNSRIFGPPPTIMSCDSLARLSALGRCAPGATAVEAATEGVLFTDNVAYLNRLLPLVNQSSRTFAGDLTTLNVSALLIKVGGAAELERVRTFLTLTYPALTGGLSGSAPITFGEVAQARAAVYIAAGRVVLVIAGMTLLVAGCSLAIAMGGGMVERKRPFTLLRVSGTATGVLRRVVLLESVLPLVTATLVAAVTGFATAIPVGAALVPEGSATPIQFPGQSYYLTMGVGLLISLAVIGMTLPLLSRITVPANVRFE